MNKKQTREALRRHHEREAREAAAARVARLVINDYPSSHNPYLPHERTNDCFSVCNPILSTASKENQS